MSKLSYSAYKKYTTCAKMYDYHYNERLRPMGTSSALVFGTAIDLALNALLLQSGDPFVIFQKAFEYDDLKDVSWDKADYDPYIFNKEQLKKINGESEDYKSWASMRIKGRMMIEAYKEKVLPHIKKVYSVQKELDGRPGILDAIVDFDGHGKILLDHKTSARPYDANAVIDDSQLALYAHTEKLDKAGFIVLVKQVNRNLVKVCLRCGFNGSFTKHKTCPQTKDAKRCHGAWKEEVAPEIIIQTLISEIPPQNKVLISEAIEQTEALITSGLFPRNLGACGKIYGKPCPYINKCWRNDEKGLIMKPKETK